MLTNEQSTGTQTLRGRQTERGMEGRTGGDEVKTTGRWRTERKVFRVSAKCTCVDACVRVIHTQYLYIQFGTLCVHVRARCPHLKAHLWGEPCQTTNQAIHHPSTCHWPLLVNHSHIHAHTHVCQSHKLGFIYTHTHPPLYVESVLAAVWKKDKVLKADDKQTN